MMELGDRIHLKSGADAIVSSKPRMDIMPNEKLLTITLRNDEIIQIKWRYLISDEDKLTQFRNITKSQTFQDWCLDLDSSLLESIIFKTITIHTVDMAGPRVLFINFSTDMMYNQEFIEKFKSGNPEKPTPMINSIVFMRGGSVAIIIILKCDDGQKYSILTKQTRIPVGKMSMEEIPAGMLDDSRNFGGVAAKEIEEETGIKIQELEFHLTPAGPNLGVDQTEFVGHVVGFESVLLYTLYYFI
jgi:hypothetical protein